MITESQIRALTEGIFQKITFPDEPKGLYDPLRYMISLGGKQIRPRLCLTTYALYKDEFTEEILQPAAALEVFHNFTLLHDDIMDKSPVRRGKPTAWTKWGEDGAILSGDVMCIDSYRRIAKAPAKALPQVLGLFCTTAAQVCEGQQLDMDFEELPEVPMSRYMKMIGLKTGVLIACAAKLGALIAGASEDDCDNLYDYGYALGLAFQVADDYLDAFGDQKVFGKPIGGDIVANKKCWLTTRSLEKADPLMREEIFATMDMPTGTTEQREAKVARMKGFYTALHVDEDAKYEIIRLTEEAMGYAARACSGLRLATLQRFAENLVGRTR